MGLATLLPVPLPEPVPEAVPDSLEAAIPITIADVAARAGVSKTTVSRVLNGRGELDQATAERVRRVIEELGYVPSARAQSLARGHARTVGLLVPSLTWPWMGELVQGVIDTVEAAGYGMLLYTCNRGQESIRQFASQVSANAFDGLIVIEPEGTLDYIDRLHRRGLPVVLIDDREHRPTFASVATTNRVGGAQAARHLIELGRRTPLVVTGEVAWGCTQERLDGFVEEYRRAGLPVPAERIVEGDFTYERGRALVGGAIEAGLAFDALFAHNDLSAAGAMQAARARGRRVPDDVAVVGFDDIPLAAHTEPGLTTVHQPMREMGDTAARLLMDSLAGQALPMTPTVLPTSLVIRASTGPAPGAPPATAADAMVTAPPA